jgi:FMN phosphatase YigB (HAD superfamily)
MTSRPRSILSHLLPNRERKPPSWLTSSPYFDAQWYREQHSDVRDAGADPLEHYWLNGMAEGRSPGPHFDALRYEAMNPEARSQALMHYHRVVLRARGGLPPQPVEVVAEDHPELESGYFDADWYVHRYPESTHVAHPYVDYYRSARSGEPRHPGPLFDTTEYLDRRPAARDATTPLAYFVEELAKGETAFVLAEPTDRGPLLRPMVGVRHRLDVCVMIHAFYPEVLPDLLQALTHLAGRATLLVSVCDAAAVEVADAHITAVLGENTPRVVKVVPNRGRNFAPLLVGFNDELRRHTYVLHLHTKKSLYSGSERTDWRGHLVRSLAGPALQAVLDLFAHHPDVGLVQPSIFHVMPPWSAHWLGNAANGRRVFERCGLDPDDVDGYIDYPVGGMFWAKVDALLPLLDARFTVDDFDPESGQTDGTLAHAIERTITAAAISRGHQFVEFDYLAGQWRHGWTTRNTDSFGVFSVESLRQQIAEADLVSVDVFDTLILRPTLAPTSLQYFAARTVTDRPDEAEEFVRRRIAAEHQARVNRPDLGDVGLDEIFEALPPEMAPLCAAEVAIEPRVAVPRQWLIDELVAAKAAGSRLVAVTDTTLPAAVVRGLLAQVGTDTLFDEWYVSNDRRARKDQGGMWPLVSAAEGVPPERWLHIGDNERSDAQQALNRNIRWSHVPSPRAVAQFYAPGGRLERGNWATQSLLGLSATALYDGRPIDEPETAFGYAVLGPIVASFLGRVVRWHAHHPDARLLLLARDTGLAHEVLELLRPMAPDVMPPADYFLVSRRAALAVSQAAGFDADLVLDSGAFDGTFADMVEARTGHRPVGDRYELRVSHPADRERCAELLAELADELVDAGRRELVGLRRYLAHLDIADSTPLCLVDLGYSATTQRALARVLPNSLAGLYCATTPAAAFAGPSVEGYFADGVPFWSGNWFLDNSLLLEALLSSAHGAVTGYQPDGPDEFVCLAPLSDGIDLHRIGAVQRAAARFCTDLVSMYGPAVLTDPIDPVAVLGWVERIPARFLASPSALFAGLRIENGFVGRPVDDTVAGGR